MPFSKALERCETLTAPTRFEVGLSGQFLRGDIRFIILFCDLFICLFTYLMNLVKC